MTCSAPPADAAAAAAAIPRPCLLDAGRYPMSIPVSARAVLPLCVSLVSDIVRSLGQHAVSFARTDEEMRCAIPIEAGDG